MSADESIKGAQGSVTKSRLAEEVAEQVGLTHKEASEVVELMFGAVARAVQGGEKVEIRGFGTFSHRSRGSRNGRNPNTGSTIKIPARRVATFRPSKVFLLDLNRVTGLIKHGKPGEEIPPQRN